MKRLLLLLVLLTMTFLASHAQGPITYIHSQLVNPGPAEVPVSVDNFNNIGAISLRLSYDTDKLEYIGISDTAISGFQTDTSNGFLYLGWMCDGLSAAPGLPDGDTLLIINFNVLTTGTSLLQWSDNGTSCEYADFPAIVPFPDTPAVNYYFDGWVSTMSVVFDRTYTPNTISAQALDGEAPYAYNWSGPTSFTSNSSTISPVTYGYYFITVTDALGAEIRDSVYYGPVHNTDSKLDYATIQAAIDASETLSGHTIRADAGSYSEAIVIDKSLSIIGSGPASTTILQSGSPIVSIESDNVNLERFTISHQGVFSASDYGVYFNNQQDISINGSEITNNGIGILVKNSSNIQISGNTIGLNEQGIVLDNVDPASLQIADNSISGNQSTGLRILNPYANSEYPAMMNWWGHSSGPYHIDRNPCGLGDTVIGEVDFDPWWYQQARNTLYGTAQAQITNNQDIKGLCNAPFIVNDTLHFPGINGYDADVLCDIALSTSEPSFPPGMELVSLSLKEGNGSAVIFDPLYDLSTSNRHLISAITGDPAATYTSYSGMTVIISMTIMAPHNTISGLDMRVEALNYINPSSCIPPATTSDSIRASFSPMDTFGIVEPRVQVLCDQVSIAFKEDYPELGNIGTGVLSNALITVVSPQPIPAGCQIVWNTSFGSGTYNISSPLTSLLISDMIGAGTANPLQDESQVIRNWSFDISGPGLAANDYELRIDGLAQTSDSDFVYASSTQYIQGLPVTQISSIDDISSITETPVIISFDVFFPSTIGSKQGLLTDVFLKSSQPFSPGTAIIQIRKENGGTSNQSSVIHDLGGTTGLFLSDLFPGKDDSLSGQAGQTQQWEISLLSGTAGWTSEINIYNVAYYDTTECVDTLSDASTFQLSFDTAHLRITGTQQNVCNPDTLKFEFSIEYPSIEDVDSRVSNDIILTSTQYYPGGTKIDWDKNNGQESGTYTLSGYEYQFMLSDLMNLSTLPLVNSLSGTDHYSFQISNMGVRPESIWIIEPSAYLSSQEYNYASGNISLTSHNCKISGYFNYNNTDKDPLGSVLVKLYREGVLLETTNTTVTGYYEFDNLINGQYQIGANSNMASGSINATDAGMLNQWQVSAFPVSPTPLEKVTFLSGDVGLPANILTSFDAFTILNHYISAGTDPWSNPAKKNWVFWTAGDQTNVNNWTDDSIPGISVSNTPIGQNFYGMVACDFNGSYTPGTKSAQESISLYSRGSINTHNPGVISIPVFSSESIELKALSIDLELPHPDLSVTSVEFPGITGHTSRYMQDNSILRIGWFSTNTAEYHAHDTLFVVHLEVSEHLQLNKPLSLSISDSPLNEFAGPDLQPIGNIELYSPLVYLPTLSRNSDRLALSAGRVFPNPGINKVNIEYRLTRPQNVQITAYSVYGAVVYSDYITLQPAGLHTYTIQIQSWASGIYFIQLEDPDGNAGKKLVFKLLHHVAQ